MKHMLIMRATADAVKNFQEMDFEAAINAMGAYNEAMIAAGVMVAGEGLAMEPGYVVDFSGDTPIVSDGPYGEVHELFNGFWIIQTATAEEALEWAKRCPLTAGNKLEVRRVTDESDFAEHADNEYIQKEKEWRVELGTE
ncbi:YciI family protein [Microbacterium thalassium]|uniref:YCII-related domain-containing protein n=1 Tax=Microbacterium thalassium TaxID=362649 RepID=A0A7X0KVZ8_9MICO|nr:YciI family protein [Microbacterium thalassium]MBB6392760.1 hypothetical protein [Microbacterium thalassium]GLK23009.1 hypothetical protein GCM10017607_03270 [Microbacterium thalassium]